MSFHIKYRPKELIRIKGNAEVICTLESLLGKKDCPHSFLLHGPTGCGKTTIARILADRLNCVGNDLREINFAEFRGIDTIRELYNHSHFMPIEGKNRMWILDECHKMTNDAQNALLKILEEPPDHVYFVLCTTDPQKLLPTIKGRCSQYQVNPLSDGDMLSLLQRVVKREKAELDKKVYDVIIRDSLGLPRNALQILEKVLSTPSEKRLRVAEQEAEQMSQSIELCRAMMKKAPWSVVAGILKGIKDQDPEGIRRMVLGYCQSTLLSNDNWRAGVIMEQFIDPFYDSGFPQLVYACYTVIKTK